MVPGKNVRPLTSALRAGYLELAQEIYDMDARSLAAGHYESVVVAIERDNVDFLAYVKRRDQIFSGLSICFIPGIGEGRFAIEFAVYRGGSAFTIC